MPQSMIERMARALCVVHGYDPDEMARIPSSGPQEAVASEMRRTISEQPRWMFERREARAVLAAMREPVDAMIEAELGHRLEIMENMGSPIESQHQAMVRERVTSQWHTMIDAALAEGT